MSIVVSHASDNQISTPIRNEIHPSVRSHHLPPFKGAHPLFQTLTCFKIQSLKVFTISKILKFKVSKCSKFQTFQSSKFQSFQSFKVRGLLLLVQRGALGALGPISWFVLVVARWPVRSCNLYGDFACAVAKKGPRWRIYVECCASLHYEFAQSTAVLAVRVRSRTPRA